MILGADRAAVLFRDIDPIKTVLYSCFLEKLIAFTS
jgi:hypothetical protein